MWLTFEANVVNNKTMSTLEQYEKIVTQSRDLFLKKTADYGTSWRVLRPIAIVDQIFIKAYRIRTIQELGQQKIVDAVNGEFTGIINYAIIGLIQLELSEADEEEMEVDTVKNRYDKYALTAKALMESKNHDYGEAWRKMSEESFVDLILMKLQRMRQIISNKGITIISEGLDANYYDIINYAVFALILMEEKNPGSL
ncbi:MAG TPA: DUF1599 domain-containing protein [Flavisolibacter sp.]|nr:DUF1599 domain-containing protein [Flavisolibacter sp.]